MKKIFLISFVFLLLVGCEQNGVLNVKECFEKIKIEEDSFKTYFNEFICDLDETDKEGVHRGGFCAKLEIKDGKCKRMYFYKKEPNVQCPNNSELETSGDCECVSKKYEWNKEKTACIEKKCPKNAELKKEETEYSWEDPNYNCFCKDGFVRTDNQENCINRQTKEYYDSYKDPYVIGLRNALDLYLKNGIQENESSEIIVDNLDEYRDYLSSKFVVLILQDGLMGGKFIKIIFQDNPDKVFVTWVYDLANVEMYQLRIFEEDNEITSEDVLNNPVMKKMIEDTDHSI